MQNENSFEVSDHQQIIAEWSAKYIDTNKFNQIISKLINLEEAKKKNMKEEGYNPFLLEQLYKELENKFWTQIDQDMDKVEVFLREEVATAKKHVKEISHVLQAKKFIKSQQQLTTIEDNIQEAYRGLDLLENYCQQNATQIRRMARLWDVNNQHHQAGVTMVKNKLMHYSFQEPVILEQLKEQLVAALALLLDCSNKVAKDKLQNIHSPNLSTKKRQKASWWCGVVLGIAIIMVVSFAQVTYFYPTEHGIIVKMTAQCTALLRIQFTLSFLIIAYSILAALCENVHINYLYLLDIPQSGTYTHFTIILTVGLIHLCIVCLFGMLAYSSASHQQLQIFIPFGDSFVHLSELLRPGDWLLLSTAVHGVALYYTMMGVLSGAALKIRHMMTVVYKILMPWAFTVDLSNFLAAALMTGMGKFIKDIANVATDQKANDWVLCCLAAYPSFMRVAQCIIKCKDTNKKFYPHLLNGSINTLGIIGCFLGAKAVNAKRGTAFWLLFVDRLFEISGKFYWDVWEDGAFFYGGTGAKEFRKKKAKWQYGKLCRRPTFLPYGWVIFYLIFNFIARWIWLVDLFCSQYAFVKNQLYQLSVIFFLIMWRMYWTVVRMDNQQATNCENYLATKYVPMLIQDEQEQKVKKQVEIKQIEVENTEDVTKTVTFEKGVIQGVVREYSDVLEGDEIIPDEFNIEDPIPMPRRNSSRRYSFIKDNKDGGKKDAHAAPLKMAEVDVKEERSEIEEVHVKLDK